MQYTHYDIIIVGASFSGLTFAHHIPRKYKVLIIDKKEKINSQMESTGLITQATKDLLDKFIPDVDNHITNKVNSIGIINSQYSQSFFSHTSKPRIYTTDTPNLLKNIANKLPSNIDIWTDSTFLKIDLASFEKELPKAKDSKNIKKKVFVTIKKGSEKITLTTSFLIGADGSRSEVAKQTGLQQNKRFLIGLEKVLEGKILLGEYPKSCIYHCWFGEFSLGYGGWLSPSIVNGKEIIRIGLAKLENGAKDLHKIDKFIKILEEKNIIKLKNNNDLGMYAGSIPIGGPLSKISNEYCLLLGDAAGLCGAFAADGIKGAIVSGKIGAKLVDKYLQGNKKSLQKFKKEIQKESGLIKYFYKQLLYRFCRDRMKSNRSFDSLFSIIEKNKSSFLNQFCDIKDKGSNLFKMLIKRKNIKPLSKLTRSLFLDFWK